MIDKESIIFERVSEALRARFEEIFITGVEITDVPPQFPAVSIVQTNSEVNKRYSTFDNVENAVSEEYKFDVYSNLESQKDAKAQTKEITDVIDEVMNALHYPRTFCKPIPTVDAKYTRRTARYNKNNVTQEEI
jgi:hypothetical protein